MKTVLSVSELNADIRHAMSDAFPSALWVHGEVSGFHANSNGHVYFDLVEKDPEKHSAVAKISCFLPAGLAKFIWDKLAAAGLEGLKNDLEIQLLATVNFYSPYGKLSLQIRDIEPAFTLGKLAQAREKIIQELTKRGLLKKNKRLELPLVPLRIGLITSEGSAAYHDFIKTLEASGFAFQVYVAPSAMQGEETEKGVTAALVSLVNLPHQNKLDIVAIVRGGGSKTDLAWFDSQVIAEAIANFPCPVLTGIGHQIDLSIADLCAHTSLKTPTAVAEFLVTHVKGFLTQIEEKSSQLVQSIRLRLQEDSHHLKDATSGLKASALAYLKTKQERIRQASQQLTWPRISRLFVIIREQIAHRQERSHALDPIHVLRRGFTLTRGTDGRFLRSVHGIHQGSMIQTHLADGKLESEVQRVSEKEGLI